MKLTPIEIKQKQFAGAFRGLEAREVTEFLQIVAEEMEQIARENSELKDRLTLYEKQLEDNRNREQALKETLLTAQKMADDIREVAEREARVTISDAELEGERLIQDALKRREQIVSELHDLKRQKIQFETTLRSAIETHLKLLEALSDPVLPEAPFNSETLAGEAEGHAARTEDI